MTVRLSSPYEGIEWGAVHYSRAQFHTHTNRRRTPDDHNGSADAHEMVDFYAERDFDVLALGDHQGAVETVTWPWTDLSGLVDTWEDRYPIGTHDEAVPDDSADASEAADATVEMVAIEGIELGSGHTPEDMVCLFSDLAVCPSEDNVDVLEAVAERDGIAWAAHPGRYGTPEDWGDRWWRTALQRVDACLGLEVYNRGYDVPAATGIWDAALAEFLPDQQVWGFAGDDMHSTDPSAYPQAWQTLFLDELDRSSVRTALETGRSVAHLVYDSEGEPTPPAVRRVDVDRDRSRVEIEADDYDAIDWISSGSTVGTGESIAVEPEHAPYVRAVLENDDGETSTQPITVEGQG